MPRAEPLLRAHLKELPLDVFAIRMFAELAGRIGRYKDSESLLRRGQFTLESRQLRPRLFPLHLGPQLFLICSGPCVHPLLRRGGG